VNKKVFVGIDGCRGGWFAVFLAAENDQNCEWEIGLFPSFSSLIDFLKKNYGQAEPLILIDIPIGLKNGGSGERLSDIRARRILKARKSSIFPVPCREAVYAESYEKACEINKELTGKSISRQAWNIIPKIRDVDAFLAKNEVFRGKVKETAPEVCFQALTDSPMKYPKKSPEGFSERMKALKSICLAADKIADSALSKYRRKEVAKDDILDALAAAVTAKMGQKYGFQYVPGESEKDSEGLNIQMVFCIPDINSRIRPETE
jgi:predicted RNase H-like nuclease